VLEGLPRPPVEEATQHAHVHLLDEPCTDPLLVTLVSKRDKHGGSKHSGFVLVTLTAPQPLLQPGQAQLTRWVSSLLILPLMPAFSRAKAVTLKPRAISSLVTNLQ